MTQSFIQLVASLRSGDVPSTEDFVRSFAEIQQELKERMRSGSEAFEVRAPNEVESRLILTMVLRQLEKSDLPKMIADAETLRRHLGLPSLLTKRVGDIL
jgi:hypothetical protein